MISDQILKARKDHECGACLWIEDLLKEQIFSFSEYRQIAKAKKNGWKIKKGEYYTKQVYKDGGGEFFTFKGITVMHEICIKHGLYQYA